MSVRIPENSIKDILFQDVVVEVKNAVDEWNLDAIRGSKKVARGQRIETAEEELFRYLSEDGDKHPWGILTNGRSFRFYHKEMATNYIEFDLFDIAKAQSKQHAYLFIRLLRDSSFRAHLLGETRHIRENQIEQHLQERILAFLEVATGDRVHQLYARNPAGQ